MLISDFENQERLSLNGIKEGEVKEINNKKCLLGIMEN